MALNDGSLYNFYPKRIDPKEHQIQKDDTVLFNNEKYHVTVVGARWLHAYKVNEDPSKIVMLRKRDVVKLFPQANETI